MRARRAVTHAMIGSLVFHLGCGSTAVCVRDSQDQIDALCLEENLRKGQEVTIRTTDGLLQDGHFVRVDQVADSTSIVLTENRPRSGLRPRTISFDLTAIDTVFEERNHLPLVPEPIPTVAGIAAVAAFFYFLLLSQISFSGLD